MEGERQIFLEREREFQSYGAMKEKVLSWLTTHLASDGLHMRTSQRIVFKDDQSEQIAS